MIDERRLMELLRAAYAHGWQDAQQQQHKIEERYPLPVKP